jgi:hypothetical protein
VVVPDSCLGSDIHGHGPGQWAANEAKFIPFLFGSVERIRPLVQPVQPIRLPTHSLFIPCLALPKRQPLGASRIPFDKFEPIAVAFAESDIGKQQKLQPLGTSRISFDELESVAVAFAESDIGKQPRPSDSPITINQLDGQCDPFHQGALSCQQHRDLTPIPSIERHRREPQPVQRFGALSANHAANNHIAVRPAAHHDLTHPRHPIRTLGRLDPHAARSLQHDTYDRYIFRPAVG